VSTAVLKPRRARRVSGRLEPNAIEPSEAPRPEHPKSTKWVLLTSSKGGSGKTTTAYNIAAFAANDGLRVGVVDLDIQGALTQWWRLRPKEAPLIRHFHATMDSFQGALDRAAAADLELVIIDTPPAIEAFDGAIRLLVRRADLCLVPSNQGGVDPSVAATWLKFLKRERARAACILNRARTNSRSFQPTKIELQSAGKLCPFEVRDLEDIKETVTLGLGVLELAKANGVEDYRGVWAFVRSELSLQDSEV
jgi:chromosome partitioning protein